MANVTITSVVNTPSDQILTVDEAAAIYETIDNLDAHKADTSTHGVGEIVGTTEEQSITNKIITLKAGTATAGTAPLKFTSGTALTTPEAGVVEFHNDRFYITNVGTRRSIDRTGDVATSTVTVENTTTETTIYTASVPANSLKVGNILKIYVDGNITSASAADTVTLRVKIGGTAIATVTSAGSGALSDACWHGSGVATLRSVGATGSMAWHFDLNVSDADDETCGIDTVDTTAAKDVTFTVEWNNAKAGNIFKLYQGFMEYKN